MNYSHVTTGTTPKHSDECDNLCSFAANINYSPVSDINDFESALENYIVEPCYIGLMAEYGDIDLDQYQAMAHCLMAQSPELLFTTSCGS